VTVHVGVLALQGDFEAHGAALARLGIEARPVRTAEEVRAGAGLVLPGGESTTMWKLMEGTGLAAAIVEVARRGDPLFATCAGVILASRHITRPDRDGLGILRATAVRNAYGRQLDSAVVTLTDLDPEALGSEPLEAVFIRAPKLAELGPDVVVLARRDGDPVLVRQGNVVAATFHPELAPDPRVHRLAFSSVLAAVPAAR
jgi:5'-phosphate synthase pdxT subunit